jgi:hypothetical protein
MLSYRPRNDASHGASPRAALAVLLIAAQGAMAAHFALVKHEYCPETGGWIHPGAVSHKQAATHEFHPPGLYAAATDDDAHSEQCALMGVRRDTALPAEASALLPVDEGLTSTLFDAAWALPTNHRFRLAPKQSPPV